MPTAKEVRNCTQCGVADDGTWYRNHGRCRPCYGVAQKARYHAPGSNKKRAGRSAHLRKKYGISIEQYNEMWLDQGGACAVCGKPETHNSNIGTNVKLLAVDHNHATGKIRALLCHKCNAALGHADEDVQRLDRLKDYLLAHG